MKNLFNSENYQTEYNYWISFYPRFSNSFYLEKAGYFDERPQVHTSVTQLLMLVLIPILSFFSLWFLLLTPFIFFGWGQLYINLPIKTGIQDCESAAWGFNYHNNKIWIYVGGGGNFEGGKKWKTITMPWDLEWYRTSTLMNDGYDWFHETKKNRKQWSGTDVGSYDWLEKNKWKETHQYVDKYDGTIVNATISVEEREWRRRGLYWSKLFSKTRKTIDVEFDKEVGKEKGSWKGGTIGCGYELLPGETPYECLKRMEKERHF
jgi:hypothetical protein